MSKIRVKIIGAGSIGNHLAHACRNRDWDVLVVDSSSDALVRMVRETYPTRYGAWDDKIMVSKPENVPTDWKSDVIFIGTPPDTHMALALKAIEERPRVLVIEKPLCAPTTQNFFMLGQLFNLHEKFAKKTMILVGYNHLVTSAVQQLASQIRKNTVKMISVRWQESWKGIFAAHPWLKGPSDSYLGFTDRGGGASGEHSHGLNLCQYLAHVAGWGRVVQVRSDFSFNQGCVYDVAAGFRLDTESGGICDVFQDVTTEPAIKEAHVQTLQLGQLTWRYRGDAQHDTVICHDAGGKYSMPMTRPDDFKYEVAHIADLLSGEAKYAESPLHINRGIETMQVLYYARKSSEARGKAKAVDVPKWFSDF